MINTIFVGGFATTPETLCPLPSLLHALADEMTTRFCLDRGYCSGRDDPISTGLVHIVHSVDACTIIILSPPFAALCIPL